MTAAPDPLEGPIEVAPEAEAERLRRQVDALQRQLEHRIRQVAHLENLVAGQQAAATAPPPDAVLHELSRKAAAYDNLMAMAPLRGLRAARRLVRGRGRAPGR